ncbi:alpha/beta hydrolase [Streptomyces sp. A7024]|uniref:Alpha/beta hydrolase n=1 Tax=Streptomyces coryli TaxID=1128680 RepID=A0A6G4U2T6_9ACTN|nr:alpha/beta hydrolase [Streptomyces coryli]NGN66060.1 alpha/beta hydrolase [Streptomyces coryli]
MTAVDDETTGTGLAALKPAEPDRTMAYGDHPSQVIDLYGTAHGPDRLIALLHGGFWRERYDRAHLGSTAAALAADLHRCVALVEYRRVGGDGGFPATFDDLPPALAALPGAGPVTLAGHSAGGHLALWAASRCPTAVSRVVAVAPVADLARGHELGLSDGAVAELLGGADRVADRLDETDPMRMEAPTAPVVLLHGDADDEVPVDLSRRYADRFGADLRVLAGAGHYDALVPGSAAYETLRGALAEG